jgi:hypothetical protein
MAVTDFQDGHSKRPNVGTLGQASTSIQTLPCGITVESNATVHVRLNALCSKCITEIAQSHVSVIIYENIRL